MKIYNFKNKRVLNVIKLNFKRNQYNLSYLLNIYTRFFSRETYCMGSNNWTESWLTFPKAKKHSRQKLHKSNHRHEHELSTYIFTEIFVKSNQVPSHFTDT